MQLGYFRTVDMYIGFGLILFKSESDQTQVYEFPPTMPLERMLDKCQGRVKKGTNIRVTLSGALCQAFCVDLPQSIVNKFEIDAFLSATAARQFDGLGTDFECKVDETNRTIAAALPVRIRKVLEDWILQQGSKLRSMQPVWAIATKNHGCQAASVKGILLQEQDGLTLISETVSGQTRALSWTGQLSNELVKVNLQRALMSFGIAENDILRLRFATKPGASINSAQIEWANHWVVL